MFGPLPTLHNAARRNTLYRTNVPHSEERWRSEGVQIGGIRSARGILGNWFDKDYDIHGPAGPTAFWKLSDEKADERTNDRSTPSLYAAFPMGGDDDDDVDDDDWVDEG